jgi:hypothetical protein
MHSELDWMCDRQLRLRERQIAIDLADETWFLTTSLTIDKE